jgi:hypothetical protein
MNTKSKSTTTTTSDNNSKKKVENYLSIPSSSSSSLTPFQSNTPFHNQSNNVELIIRKNKKMIQFLKINKNEINNNNNTITNNNNTNDNSGNSNNSNNRNENFNKDLNYIKTNEKLKLKIKLNECYFFIPNNNFDKILKLIQFYFQCFLKITNNYNFTLFYQFFIQENDKKIEINNNEILLPPIEFKINYFKFEIENSKIEKSLIIHQNHSVFTSSLHC